MKMRLVYTLRAQQDLKNIYEYIAYSLQSPQVAQGMSNRLMQAAHSLEDMPERNPLYREEPWHSQGVRFLPVKNYLRWPCGIVSFPVCPRCRATLEREYQAFCDRCGQCLSWKNLSKATVILPEK